MKPASPADKNIRQEIKRRTIISFSVLIICGLLVWWGISRIYGAPKADEVQAPLRAVLEANEAIFGSTMSHTRLAKTYPVSAADQKVRVNGDLGLKGDFDTASWKMKVARAPGDTLYITMGDIKKLPKTDITFDFKCIEGWDQVTHWSGVKMEDFIKAYHLEALTQKKYMGLQTPDGGYYVGLDMASAIHPQTLLCYEVNNAPLPLNQGAPLRLIIPVKYGIKHLKRIGTMFFSDAPPRDYWAEAGYDYYAGH